MSTKKENKIYLYCIILLIIVSIVTIIFTKYNKYYENRTINEIKKNVVIVKDGKVKKENEGKLVLVNGKLDYGDEILHDDLFDISIQTPRLFRYIEVYQWFEYKTKDKNGNTIYKYVKKWDANMIDSDKFQEKKYINPKGKIENSKFFYAKEISINEFTLSEEQKGKLPCPNKIRINPNIKLEPQFKIYDNYITNSIDPYDPQIGDARISYYYNSWKEATVLAVQSKNSFESYTTKTDLMVNHLGEGKLSLSEMAALIEQN